MSRVSFSDSADQFFRWCARILTNHREAVLQLVSRSRRGESIDRKLFLPTRFALDGRPSEVEWSNFQLDGYGTWMWALTKHAARHGLDLTSYKEPLNICSTYLAQFWREPCFDWWEENPFDVHPATLGAILAGLRAALSTGLLNDEVARKVSAAAEAISDFFARSAVSDGRLTKSIGRSDIDASLITCLTPFGIVEAISPVGQATYNAIVKDLAPDGVHRYLADTYYGGGRWILLAGFVGWHEASIGHRERALTRLEWMHDQFDSRGFLPEQVTASALHPADVRTWQEKWGPVATPLLWSHAMYITLAEALSFFTAPSS